MTEEYEKEKKTNVKDLGMTFEEAVLRPDFFACYQLLGKYYTSETFHTAPPVLLGQCPSCGEFSWDEHPEANIGKCDHCNFVG